MELKDTVEMMLSDDYRERFKAEYYQTKIRYEKLKKFGNEIEAAQLMAGEESKFNCRLMLIRDQQRHMGQYLHILEIRAEIEHIDVE